MITLLQSTSNYDYYYYYYYDYIYDWNCTFLLNLSKIANRFHWRILILILIFNYFFTFWFPYLFSHLFTVIRVPKSVVRLAKRVLNTKSCFFLKFLNLHKNLLHNNNIIRIIKDLTFILNIFKVLLNTKFGE